MAHARPENYSSLKAALVALVLVGCGDERDAGLPGGPLYPPPGMTAGESTDGLDTGMDDGTDGGETGGADDGGEESGDPGDSGTSGDSTGGDPPGGDPTTTGGDPTTTGGDPGGDDPYDADRDTCVDLINDYRATLGVAPLTRWEGKDAEDCVDNQAKVDSLEGGGVHELFGACGEALQNEGGWSGGMYPGFEQNLASMWAEGPGGGHYENMASPQVTEVLCGFYQSTAGAYAGWWSAVQDFR